MVSKTPFMECLEESSAPCAAMRFLCIKKERDNTLAVEKVCNMWCLVATDDVQFSAGAWTALGARSV
jgi:hypothetical protein